jgi:hypothetical protein
MRSNQTSSSKSYLSVSRESFYYLCQFKTIFMFRSLKFIFPILLISFSLNAQYDFYTTEEYSIKYPADWSIDTSGIMGTDFILFSAIGSEKDQFRENVSLLVQDVSEYDLDLDKYVEISLEQVKTMITNGKLILSERKNGSYEEYNFHRVVYTGKQGVFDLRFEQYIWLEDGLAFILTSTSEQDAYNTFSSYFDEILKSFQFNY